MNQAKKKAEIVSMFLKMSEQKEVIGDGVDVTTTSTWKFVSDLYKEAYREGYVDAIKDFQPIN